MTKHGKAYADATQKYDRDQPVAARDALERVRSLAPAKFDETVEAAFRLGVDPRKADQMVRGTVSLPNGTGKAVKVAVFATGDAARQAEAAGADIVGADDLVARVEGGDLDFDVAIATPDLMGKVEYRTDRNGNVHVPIGKVSFDTDALLDNYQAVLDELMRAKPAAAKGRYIKAASAASTMGPGVKIDPAIAREDDSPKGGPPG